MLVFDHLNSSLPAIFDDLFKPFQEHHKEIRLKYRKNKNLFLWFQISSGQIN